jgi:type IV pilus assembly protein PilV
MKKPSNNQKGFSLLELLVAVSLLAVGLLAAAGMQGVALNSNSLSNRISTGAMIAQQAMEDIYSWPAERFVGGSAGNYDLNPGGTEETIVVAGSGTYSASYSITTNTPIIGVAQVVVAVTRVDSQAASGRVYNTTRGERRIVTLTTYKRM